MAADLLLVVFRLNPLFDKGVLLLTCSDSTFLVTEFHIENNADMPEISHLL